MAMPPHPQLLSRDHTTGRPPDPTPDQCPRCGQSFACGMTGNGPCPCTTVHLDAVTLAGLRAHYQGCLCLRCLQALAAGDDVAPACRAKPVEAA